jgi:Fe-S cluster biosynthesis and repair protein YggX
MEDTFNCSRCSRTGGQLDEAPVPGEVGEEIRRAVCRACWAEWQQMEVMVINELRLNFMDPKAAQILEQHMRQFLLLEESDPGE